MITPRQLSNSSRDSRVYVGTDAKPALSEAEGAVHRAKLDRSLPTTSKPPDLTASATHWIISAVPPRSTVGHLPLEQGIGVRIPGGQPNAVALKGRDFQSRSESPQISIAAS